MAVSEKQQRMKELAPGSRLQTSVAGGKLNIGNVGITFVRTLRIPDDNNEYPLPPGLGHFPILKVSDYLKKVPKEWRDQGGIFLPMYQREAMWLNFDALQYRPNVLKVAVGKINALTGELWKQELSADPQDYVIVPSQPWLDGINAGEGFIKQFVAMPLGMGYTVEGQISGKEEFGGVQLIVFDPKQGKFPDEPPVYKGGYASIGRSASGQSMASASAAPTNNFFSASLADSSLRSTKGKQVWDSVEYDFAGPIKDMGLAAGGKMKQSIYPDPHGIDTWDLEAFGRVYVHIVNSTDWEKITGSKPPATPVDARSYTQAGYPWFDLYDEAKGDIAASDKLGDVKSVKQMDKDKGFGSQQDDSSVKVKKKQIKTIAPNDLDGKW